jgi:hypothetical protein
MPSAEKSTARDDALTICSISVIASMLSTMLHEGLGHAAIALLTGAHSGTLSTVAWSSEFDSRLVAAGGTLVNLAAAFLLWIALRAARNTSARVHFFLLIAMAFNLFTGTGYFFFSGVTNFGDWAQVIAGMHPYWLWRTMLIAVGVAAYYCAMVIVGISLVHFLGVSPGDNARIRRLMILPYLSALVLEGVAGCLNPIGLRLVFESALAATAGANAGMLWIQYYIPKRTIPGPNHQPDHQAIRRNYAWIVVAGVLAIAFIFILGRGIHLAA